MEKDTVKLTSEGTDEVLEELGAPAEDNAPRRGLFDRMKRIAERLERRIAPSNARPVHK